ncbi:MAG: molybdate ABC transporter substrate-binding protein [Candidatus Kapabacteria bacterium]|nr:molybdate ABC transporter substrate-binding protein [Candidatus Kapabacteria bacterium]
MKKKYISSTLSFLLFLTASMLFGAQEKCTVVLAANMKTAMDSIVSAFKADNPGTEPEILYGASGKFYEQIINAAPFDLFLSADMEYPQKLKEKGQTASEIKLYAIGHLVIWSKKIDPNISKMNCLLETSLNKISIANPKTAPYGEKAIESMKYYKIYDKIQNKLVFGENITQAAQFVTTGAADIGIIALSQALSPALIKENGKFYLVPDESHKPLEQGCVVLAHGKTNSTAKKLYDFMSTAKVINILKHFGYSQKK